MLGFLLIWLPKKANHVNRFSIFFDFLTMVGIRSGRSTLGFLLQSSLGVGGFFLDFCGFLPCVGVTQLLGSRTNSPTGVYRVGFRFHAGHPHQVTDDNSVLAPKNCCTNTSTRRCPRNDRPPVPGPVHHAEPDRDFADTQPATELSVELSECIGWGWGLGLGADDEHEPCLPSGGRESNGRSGRCVGVGRICGTAGP